MFGVPIQSNNMKNQLSVLHTEDMSEISVFVIAVN